MNTYISLLRGINVSGQKKILMQELKGLYENLGFLDIQTYIQSGNVVFRSSERDSSSLDKSIKKAIFANYQFEVEVIMRTLDEMIETVKHNPFFNSNSADIKKLAVVFFQQQPETEKFLNIEELDAGDDLFSHTDREIFLYVEKGFAKTKLTNVFFEKKLGIPATTRNWRTVTTLIGIGQSL
ncbi:MAG: DUF1697 domain-containing protein [Spirochaetales bacterium]|jgi:uncharacterized protein (DUF1697 family)|nr:DUF1697 domain-containing protein [Spirochaetales bacterium]